MMWPILIGAPVAAAAAELVVAGVAEVLLPAGAEDVVAGAAEVLAAAEVVLEAAVGLGVLPWHPTNPRLSTRTIAMTITKPKDFFI
jgi:hypothetical protein